MWNWDSLSSLYIILVLWNLYLYSFTLKTVILGLLWLSVILGMHLTLFPRGSLPSSILSKLSVYQCLFFERLRNKNLPSIKYFPNAQNTWAWLAWSQGPKTQYRSQVWVTETQLSGLPPNVWKKQKSTTGRRALIGTQVLSVGRWLPKLHLNCFTKCVPSSIDCSPAFCDTVLGDGIWVLKPYLITLSK